MLRARGLADGVDLREIQRERQLLEERLDILRRRVKYCHLLANRYLLEERLDILRRGYCYVSLLIQSIVTYRYLSKVLLRIATYPYF